MKTTVTLALILLVAMTAFARGNPEVNHPGYHDYSLESYEAAEGKTRVLFFHASWCPSCRSSETSFLETVDQIPEDIVILKVNYDKERELKKQYGITSQHTFVQVDAEGNAVVKWSGGALEMLLEKVDLG